MTLLTVDEARAAVVASAARLLRLAECSPATLELMLFGVDAGDDRGVNDHLLALEHHRVLEVVRSSGHGWIIEDELEGVASAAALAEGERRWEVVAACVSAEAQW